MFGQLLRRCPNFSATGRKANAIHARGEVRFCSVSSQNRTGRKPPQADIQTKTLPRDSRLMRPVTHMDVDGARPCKPASPFSRAPDLRRVAQRSAICGAEEWRKALALFRPTEVVAALTADAIGGWCRADGRECWPLPTRLRPMGRHGLMGQAYRRLVLHRCEALVGACGALPVALWGGACWRGWLRSVGGSSWRLPSPSP